MIIASPEVLGPLFGLSELGLLLWKRSRGGAQSVDGGSLGLLWGVIFVSLVAAGVCAALLPVLRSPRLHSLDPLAVALFGLGALLRWYAIFYLGRLFTVNVAIAADHQLVDSGPYRSVRHPSYTGALLMFLGLGMSFDNWLSLLLAVAPAGWAFRHRMGVEEAALSRALGAPYLNYMARTKRLIPGVY